MKHIINNTFNVLFFYVNKIILKLHIKPNNNIIQIEGRERMEPNTDLNNIDPNKFIFEKENGERIECETVLSFYAKDVDKNYILFTDNTFDEENNLRIYAYYNSPDDETLKPVEDEKEFEMVNEIFEQYKGEE